MVQFNFIKKNSKVEPNEHPRSDIPPYDRACQGNPLLGAFGLDFWEIFYIGIDDFCIGIGENLNFLEIKCKVGKKILVKKFLVRTCPNAMFGLT